MNHIRLTDKEAKFFSVSQKKIDKSKDLLLFIDGTVAGTPIVVPGNPEVTNETYRGGVCTSETHASCSTYSLNTVDNESLYVGTFYNAHAITVDSSKTITANNTNFPDTFCPLGWQLPYDGTGGDYYNKSKSWGYLYGQYLITNSSSGSEKLRSYPISQIFGGEINNGGKFINFAGFRSSYHSITNNEERKLYRTESTPDMAKYDNTNFKQVGYSARCD